MSASLDTIFVVGYQIPGDRLVRTRRERGCGCLSDGRSFNFCPECGTQWMVVTKERFLGDSDEVGAFTVRTEGWEQLGNLVAYIGTEVKQGVLNLGQLQHLFRESLREELEAELRMLDIKYDDCVFGLHLKARIC